MNGKWIIVVTLPSGMRYAFSHKDRTFALSPIDGNRIHHADAWDSEEEARKHLKKQLAVAPELAKMAPFEFVQVVLAH